MLVRRAQDDDLAALADLGLASWQRGIGPHVPPSVREAVRRHNPFVAFLREQGGKVLMAEIDGTAAGLAAREADDAHLSDLWVAPRFEGRGVGSALLLAVEREVARAGFDAITLEVLTANTRAASFYRRRGYEVTWQGMRRDSILVIDLHKTAMRKGLACARCR